MGAYNGGVDIGGVPRDGAKDSEAFDVLAGVVSECEYRSHSRVYEIK